MGSIPIVASGIVLAIVHAVLGRIEGVDGWHDVDGRHDVDGHE